MTIRKAQWADIPVLRAIYNEEVLHGTASFDTEEKSMADREAWFRAHGDGYPLLVAEEDGAVAGYASLSVYRERPAYRPSVELSVYVHKDHRRRGIGEALMQELLALARGDERIRNVISIITGGNTASIALHEKLGFRFVGRLHDAGEKFGRRLDVDFYEYLV